MFCCYQLLKKLFKFKKDRLSKFFVRPTCLVLAYTSIEDILLCNQSKKNKIKTMESYQTSSKTDTTQMAEAIEIAALSKVEYTGKTHTIGGRNGGSSHSSDDHLDIQLMTPGTSQIGTNPEQLFAAGWSACFISAMRIEAGKMKVRFPPDTAIDAEVDLCKNSDGYFLQARLTVSLPGLDRTIAQALVDSGEQNCPYSKATRGNIKAEFTLV
jgi:lipoyl-dependent peroxiredoxin